MRRKVLCKSPRSVNFTEGFPALQTFSALEVQVAQLLRHHDLNFLEQLSTRLGSE